VPAYLAAVHVDAPGPVQVLVEGDVEELRVPRMARLQTLIGRVLRWHSGGTMVLGYGWRTLIAFGLRVRQMVQSDGTWDGTVCGDGTFGDPHELSLRCHSHALRFNNRPCREQAAPRGRGRRIIFSLSQEPWSLRNFASGVADT